jgi:NAD(P)H dehydrogenase (quinone)
MAENSNMTRVVIVGGGPGGYEAALVARKSGAQVTLVHSDGLGGSAVLTDVVPSKGLIAVGEILTVMRESSALGISLTSSPLVNLLEINQRLTRLAAAQSSDIEKKLIEVGVELVKGRGVLTQAGVRVEEKEYEADAVLIATGASPRTLDAAKPDGDRIFTWEQLYSLQEVPSKLIVVGSGVTGAEFASAFHAIGAEVVLISSRDRVLPSEDADAARVIEQVFARRGIHVQNLSRAVAARRTDSGVVVELADGTLVEGSHCLMAVGSIPNTKDLNLADLGVTLDKQGFIEVDRVSQTSRRGVYAAGDCTKGMMLASTAAMQGRIAMHHALGNAVTPFEPKFVSSNVFTDPEIANVGVSEADAVTESMAVFKLPLSSNPRAKMLEFQDGFVKLIADKASGIVLGGVVVAPKASELIYPIAIAVTNRLRVQDLAQTFTIYPSLSGSIAEAARQIQS